MVDRILELEEEEINEKSYDASDPEQVKKARKNDRIRKRNERDTLRTMMQYPNGRNFMYNSVRCILEGDPVVPGDAYSTYYNLGQEHRARELFKEIVVIAPKEFTLMIEENKINK